MPTETTYTLTSLAAKHFDYIRKEIDPLEVPRYLGSGASADAVLGLMEHTQARNQHIKLAFLLYALHFCFLVVASIMAG